MGPQPGALSHPSPPHPPTPSPCPSRPTLRHLLGADSRGREGPASGEQADPCEASARPCFPLLALQVVTLSVLIFPFAPLSGLVLLFWPRCLPKTLSF